MVDHVTNRDTIVLQLKSELFGPAPVGEEIDCTKAVIFDKAEDAYGPWRQKGTGEEILLRDPPTKRYGIGVLYPAGSREPDSTPSVNNDDAAATESAISSAGVEQAELIAARDADDVLAIESDDFDLSLANALKPSTMALSFLVDLPAASALVVEVHGARYEPKSVMIAGSERQWWLRKPISLRAEFSEGRLLAPRAVTAKPETIASEDIGDLALEVQVFSRPQPAKRQRLVTVCLINRSNASAAVDEACLFQSFFKAYVHVSGEPVDILPYPTHSNGYDPDSEEASIELVYRKSRTFATGHGCAANWGGGIGPSGPCELRWSRLENDILTKGGVNWVSAECLPAIEIPNMTPAIRRSDGSEIEISMEDLANLEAGSKGFAALSEIVSLYEDWIRKKEQEVLSLDIVLRTAAVRNLGECRRCAERMNEGIEYLKTDPAALQAFRLANKAILLQQVRYRRTPRRTRFDIQAQRLQFAEPYIPVEPLNVPQGRGKWRAFQIAFLLMSIRSCADGAAPDRDTVELIWFPTGGGKTEAYLGLAAFSMLMDRLTDPSNFGVHVLMRYTLRLLTAQQFQRASGLICALEHIRRQNKNLGDNEFSIGIWLGGDTTPNKRKDAVTDLRALQSESKLEPENRFVIGHCPWCGAEMGRIKYETKAPKDAPKVTGYIQKGDTVAFRCPDSKCEFSGRLPIYVIDEDVYDFRPTLVIGTVDKFAMLAWEPRARALFGLDDNGQQLCQPPNLIIQDELHLISGPLGSMVGLYEVIIEELCTRYAGKVRIRPKWSSR